MGNNNINLPPGFRFYPSDEDLVVHFLHRKAALLPCHPDVIPDLELYPCDPWELDGKALAEGKRWYFYSRRTQHRNTENGYWKPIGIEEPVLTSSQHRVGLKNYLVFYFGEAPAGLKTNWIMEEFRLSDSSASSSSRSSSKTRKHKKDYSKWVICRVYERNCDDDDDDDSGAAELSCLDEVFLSLDDLDENEQTRKEKLAVE